VSRRYLGRRREHELRSKAVTINCMRVTGRHTSADACLNQQTLYNNVKLVDDAHEGRGVAKHLAVNSGRKTLDDGWSDSSVAEYRKPDSAVEDSGVSWMSRSRTRRTSTCRGRRALREAAVQAEFLHESLAR
jgi:hypothetical protein